MEPHLMTINERKWVCLVERFPEKFEDFIIRYTPDNLPNNFHFEFGLMACWVEIYPDGNFYVTKDKPDTANELFFIKKTYFEKYRDLNGVIYEPKKSPGFPGQILQ